MGNVKDQITAELKAEGRKKGRSALVEKLFMFAFFNLTDKDANEAEDLVMETVTKAMEEQGNFDGENIYAWLKQSLKNNWIDNLRKSKNKNAEKIIGEFKGSDVNGIDSEFTLKEEAKDLLRVRVYINDVFQPQVNYSISGTSLKFSTPPKEDSVIEIIKYKGPTGLESLESEHVEGDQEASIIKDDLERCLEELKEIEREIVGMLSKGFGYKEICEDIGYKEGHLRVVAHRSRKQLADCLEGKE